MQGGTNFQTTKNRDIITTFNRKLKVEHSMKIELSNIELQKLKEIVTKRNNSYAQVVRSKIILLSDEGIGYRKVSKILGGSRDIVIRWRKRWIDSKNQDVSRDAKVF